LLFEKSLGTLAGADPGGDRPPPPKERKIKEEVGKREERKGKREERK